MQYFVTIGGLLLVYLIFPSFVMAVVHYLGTQKVCLGWYLYID